MDQFRDFRLHGVTSVDRIICKGKAKTLKALALRLEHWTESMPNGFYWEDQQNTHMAEERIQTFTHPSEKCKYLKLGHGEQLNNYLAPGIVSEILILLKYLALTYI